MIIEPNKYYRPQDEAMRIVGAVQTLAKWRSEKTGPVYLRSGSKVLYKGSDVLAFLEGSRVEPTA